ncbi:hypothetical protein VTH06DRAFT_311 [Thermothelomyces fergusii]
MVRAALRMVAAVELEPALPSPTVPRDAREPATNYRRPENTKPNPLPRKPISVSSGRLFHTLPGTAAEHPRFHPRHLRHTPLRQGHSTLG